MIEEQEHAEKTTEASEKENPQPQERRRNIMKGLLEIAIYIAIILACIYVIPTYVAQRTIVAGSSMNDNLQDKDNLLVNKLAYAFSGPNRFDVIVFYPHGNKHPDTFLDYMKGLLPHSDSEDALEKEETDDYYIKRVIGLPGETIQIQGSDIYIDGELLKEDYGKMPITNPGIAKTPLTLGEDEYFVLGDNREISLDSRYESVGPVKKELIAGKAVLRIWPVSGFGFIK